MNKNKLASRKQNISWHWPIAKQLKNIFNCSCGVLPAGQKSQGGTLYTRAEIKGFVFSPKMLHKTEAVDSAYKIYGMLAKDSTVMMF